LIFIGTGLSRGNIVITEDDEFERLEREQKMRLDLARENMAKLTEASLVKALEEMLKMREGRHED
jgi:hypothetical protein